MQATCEDVPQYDLGESVRTRRVCFRPQKAKVGGVLTPQQTLSAPCWLRLPYEVFCVTPGQGGGVPVFTTELPKNGKTSWQRCSRPPRPWLGLLALHVLRRRRGAKEPAGCHGVCHRLEPKKQLRLPCEVVCVTLIAAAYGDHGCAASVAVVLVVLEPGCLLVFWP